MKHLLLTTEPGLTITYNAPETFVTLSGKKDAIDFLRTIIPVDHYAQQCIYLLLCNSCNHLLLWRCLNIGSISQVKIDGRLLVNVISKVGAASVIIGHTCPEGVFGYPAQSIADEAKKAKTLIELCDCALMDYLLLDSQKEFSLIEDGQL